MCNSPSITKAIVVATLAAMLIPTSLARAQTIGVEDPFVTASAPVDGDRDTQPLTCKEKREAAWFIHEMARTDGDVSPEAPAVACSDETSAD